MNYPQKKKILVIGGCGFIGSHIVDKLVSNHNKVVVLDDLSTGSLKNFNNNAILHQGDVCNELFTKKIFEKYKFDYVIHQAAKINTNALNEIPLVDLKNTVASTIVVAKECIKNNVKNLIFASSVAVYGRPKSLPVIESSPLNPIYSYGIAKKNAEEYLKYFHTYYNLNYHVLRYANVYGPRQPIFGEVGVIAIFTDRFIQGKDFTIFGDGKQQRDYIYIDDIVSFTLNTLTFKKPSIYNVGSGIPSTVNEVFDKFREYNPKYKNAIYKNERFGEIGNFYTTINKALKTGWKPKFNLDQGIKKTINFFKSSYHE